MGFSSVCYCLLLGILPELAQQGTAAAAPHPYVEKRELPQEFEPHTHMQGTVDAKCYLSKSKQAALELYKQALRLEFKCAHSYCRVEELEGMWASAGAESDSKFECTSSIHHAAKMAHGPVSPPPAPVSSPPPRLTEEFLDSFIVIPKYKVRYH